MNDLDQVEVEYIQKTCGRAMHLWGYNTLSTDEFIDRKKNPIAKFNFQ